MEHIGEAIREHRRRLDLTQEDLAARAGLAPTSIVRLEKGEVKNPHINTVLALSEVLGVNLMPFVAGSPVMEASSGLSPVGPFTAVYERDGDWWVVSVPEIPGAHSQGKTLEEARFMIRDAVTMLLEVRREEAEREAVEAGHEVIREPLAL